MSKLSIVTSAKACMCLTAKDIFLVKINMIKPGNAYTTVKDKITSNSDYHMVIRAYKRISGVSRIFLTASYNIL